MTRLQRTELTLAQKIHCAAQALGRQAHGVITALSLELGISRPTVYEAAATAEAVLAHHFALAERKAVSIEVDQAQLRRAVIALRTAAPDSIRAIEELIPLLYPGHQLSYGKRQAWLVEAEQQAARFNAKADLSAIVAGALDELYSQGDPVLAGIDLDAGYLFSLALRESRSGEDWAEVLGQAKSQGLSLAIAVKDAAKGIARGVSEVFPQAEQRDDCFHACFEMNKIRQRLERRAYAAIEHEQSMNDQLSRLGDRQTRLSHKHKLAWARRRCQRAIDDYDAFEAAVGQARAAMQWVDLDSGQLRSAQQVAEALCQAAEAMRAVDYPGCSKVANYLTNRAPGLGADAEQLHDQLSALAASYDEQAVSLAAVIIQLLDALNKRCPHWQRQAYAKQLLGAYHLLSARLGKQTDPLLEQVQQLWQQRHRASSAIEGFNASLRPYLYVQKGVSQGFLELYRAYYNLRTRRWGRHKGTSAHQCLTGQPVEDWLTMLGFPPSQATVH